MGRGKKGRKLLLLALIGAGYAAFRAKNKTIGPTAAWEAPTPRPSDPSPPTEKAVPEEDIAAVPDPATEKVPAEVPEEAAEETAEAEVAPEPETEAEATPEPETEAAPEPEAQTEAEATGDPLSDPLSGPLAEVAPAAEDDGSFFEQVMAESGEKAPKRRTRRTAKDKPAE